MTEKMDEERLLDPPELDQCVKTIDRIASYYRVSAGDLAGAFSTLEPPEEIVCCDGQLCRREAEYGHPCDRDESGQYDCERQREAS